MENFKVKQSEFEKNIVISLKQNFDSLNKIDAFLEDSETTPLNCSDFGVVSGKIISNNNVGIPNVKVGIFIPLDDKDSQDPIISAIYPYITTSTLNNLGYRYNLLPRNQQHSFHTPVGTFFTIDDIASSSIIKYIYEKYYKFCTTTNENGEFLIYGVPVGAQILHIDLDVSDVGFLSMRPEVLIDLGEDPSEFVVNEDGIYSFKASQNLDDLVQIKSLTREIIVSPLLGDRNQCDTGITNLDINIDFNFVPYAIFFGSLTADVGRPITTRAKKTVSVATTTILEGEVIPLPNQSIFETIYENLRTSLRPYIDPVIYSVSQGNSETPTNITTSIIVNLEAKPGDIEPVKHPIIIKRTDIYGNIKEFRYPNGHFVMFLPMNYRFVIFDLNGNEILQNNQNGLATEGIYSFEFIIDADPDSEDAQFVRNLEARDFDFGRTNYTKSIGFTPKVYDPELYFFEQQLRSFNNVSGGTAVQLIYDSLYGALENVDNSTNLFQIISTVFNKTPIVAINDNMDFSHPDLINYGNKLKKFISRGGFPIFSRFKYSKQGVNKYTFYQDIEQKDTTNFRYLDETYSHMFNQNNKTKFKYVNKEYVNNKVFGNLLMLKLNTTQPFSNPDLAFTTVNKPNYRYVDTSQAPTNGEINSVVQIANHEYPITFSTGLYKLTDDEFKKVISYEQEINGNIYNTDIRLFYRKRQDIQTATYIEVDSLVDQLNKYKINE